MQEKEELSMENLFSVKTTFASSSFFDLSSLNWPLTNWRVPILYEHRSSVQHAHTAKRLTIHIRRYLHGWAEMASTVPANMTRERERELLWLQFLIAMCLFTAIRFWCTYVHFVYVTHTCKSHCLNICFISPPTTFSFVTNVYQSLCDVHVFGTFYFVSSFFNRFHCIKQQQIEWRTKIRPRHFNSHYASTERWKKERNNNSVDGDDNGKTRQM